MFSLGLAAKNDRYLSYYGAMDKGKYNIDILNQQEDIVDKKPRVDVVKGVDIYHAVYVVLVTPRGEVALSKIANRADLPNVHHGAFGCTAATIRRSGETAEQAAERAVNDELHIDETPELVYQGMQAVDGTHRLVGLYKIVAEPPTSYSKIDIDEIVTFSQPEFEAALKDTSGTITPMLRLFWKKHQSNGTDS